MPLMRPAVAAFLLLALAAACSSGGTSSDSAAGDPPGASSEQAPPASPPLGPDGAILPAPSDGGMDAGDADPPPVPYQHFEGTKWEPLRPVAITLQGNVVTARFLVPKPPLVLDTQRVSNPGNYGFEFSDESGAPPAITNVAIAGPDTVTVTLAAAPTGANKRLRYAYTFGGCGGSGTTARGNLRDSDDTPSQAGYDLSNWSVHFDEAIP